MSNRTQVADHSERILKAIEDLTLQRGGVPPTVREIGAAVGFSSTATIHKHLKRLRDAEAVLWDKAIPRSIRVAGGDSELDAIWSSVGLSRIGACREIARLRRELGQQEASCEAEAA